ncbi:hypothetical protein [Streptomyces sp. NPDC003719]
MDVGDVRHEGRWIGFEGNTQHGDGLSPGFRRGGWRDFSEAHQQGEEIAAFHRSGEACGDKCTETEPAYRGRRYRVLFGEYVGNSEYGRRLPNGTYSLTMLLSRLSLFIENSLNFDAGPVRYLRIGPLHARKELVQFGTGPWSVIHAAIEDIRKRHPRTPVPTLPGRGGCAAERLIVVRLSQGSHHCLAGYIYLQVV